MSKVSNVVVSNAYITRIKRNNLNNLSYKQNIYEAKTIYGNNYLAVSQRYELFINEFKAVIEYKE